MALNTRLAEKTGALYCGIQPLETFYAMVARCRTVVTGVTIALHLAIGQKIAVVLLNSIFNPREFELYGRGVVVPKNYSRESARNPGARSVVVLFSRIQD